MESSVYIETIKFQYKEKKWVLELLIIFIVVCDSCYSGVKSSADLKYLSARGFTWFEHDLFCGLKNGSVQWGLYSYWMTSSSSNSSNLLNKATVFSTRDVLFPPLWITDPDL